MRNVRETARYVSEISSHVQIRRDAVADFSRRLYKSGIKVPPWSKAYHLCEGGRETVSYLLVLDALNFCFWLPEKENRWEVAWESESLSGYFALAASLATAMQSGIPLARADYLAGLSGEMLQEILGGKGKLQLMEERARILNEVGYTLDTHYHGEASALVEAAESSAEKLVRLLAEGMPSFRDVSEYRGRRVYFYKRAQIFCADLYGAFDGRGWGDFKDIDQLTAFADYKLPQVLRELNILCYDDELARKVDNKEPVDPGSPEEIEIRANTIFAVDLIREEAARLGRRLRDFEIDWILWDLGQQDEFTLRPHHNTVTIFY